MPRGQPVVDRPLDRSRSSSAAGAASTTPAWWWGSTAATFTPWRGNTGYSAGYGGGAVLERTYGRNDSRITGYGVPRWPMAGGLVSSQPWYCYGYTPSLVSVERCYCAEGSSLVCAIQLVVDADVDGLMGPQTVRCLQA